VAWAGLHWSRAKSAGERRRAFYANEWFKNRPVQRKSSFASWSGSVILAFLVSLIYLLIPAGLSLLVVRRSWRFVSLHFPIALAVHMGLAGLIGLLVYRLFGLGDVQSFAVLALALGGAVAILRGAFSHGEGRQCHKDVGTRFPIWVPLGILAAAFLSVADLAIIFGEQGWEIDGGTNYFRNPLNTDNERNVVLVRALERGTASPFIPNSDLIYAYSWHNLAALILTPFVHEITFPDVMGVTLATAVAFFIMIYATVLSERPSLARNWPWAAAVFIIASTHADIYHVLGELVDSQLLGVRASDAAALGYFKTFSPKMLAMTAPQHATFMILLLAVYLLNYGRLKSTTSMRSVSEIILVSAGVATSPILAGIAFPLTYGLMGLKRLRHSAGQSMRTLGRALALMAGSFVIFLGLYGFSPMVYVERPAAIGGSVTIPIIESIDKFAFMPLMLVGILGVTGVLVTLLMSYRVVRSWPFILTYWPLFLLTGSLAFYYVISSNELNRHWSLVAATIGSIVVARCLPTWRVLRSKPALQGLCAGAVFLSLVWHAPFVATFTQRPNSLASHVPWQDYLCMNQVIEKQYPGLPVAAAVGHGIFFPVATRVTTSAAFGDHTIAVHSRLTAEQWEIYEKVKAGETVIDHALALGYSGLIWGPVEDLVWGVDRAARYARPDLRMATCGSVGLFRLPKQSESEMTR
jgi:hypothetical protein